MKKRRPLSLLFSRGFTLIELMASIAIISIILTVVIYNHRAFDSQLELTNVAYRVAVSIREAQVYGTSVKEFNDNSVRRFDVPYGVSFYNTNLQELSYVFFGDSNPNLGDHPNTYDGPINTGCVGASGANGDTPDECIERITLGGGNMIKKVCAFGSSLTSGGACIPMSGNYLGDQAYLGINSFNIVFKRPKSDAIITAAKTINGISTPVLNAIEPLRDIYICLKSPEGKNKAVHVSTAGQISVEDVLSAGTPGSGQCYFN
jgi:prepilin-type N-terminal cleavage/methylation domain-containing protein